MGYICVLYSKNESGIQPYVYSLITPHGITN